MVKEALIGSRWMRGLHRLVNEAKLDQFLNLRTVIQSVHLTENTLRIEIQLFGTLQLTRNIRFALPKTSSSLACSSSRTLRFPWEIRAEGKAKFYFCLLLLSRNWTADRLLARGWPHNDVCCLCDQHPERRTT
ncbi:hypothetical protein QYE76_057097 [Lolium multiflorum]|uniref:Reverse transcriptase zinc-binding domain-containing protein n=1 Tax=Lolium multiflorum TaxID=4521 RepID=A0AAD8T2Y2_LOLMU|nr:hypothetical protein QYE76_057097 [Lolium multiflorum]